MPPVEFLLCTQGSPLSDVLYNQSYAVSNLDALNISVNMTRIGAHYQHEVVLVPNERRLPSCLSEHRGAGHLVIVDIRVRHRLTATCADVEFMKSCLLITVEMCECHARRMYSVYAVPKKWGF